MLYGGLYSQSCSVAEIHQICIIIVQSYILSDMMTLLLENCFVLWF